MAKKKTRAKNGRKKARSPAQKAATKRMLAANRAARGGRPAKRSSAKRAAKKGSTKSIAYLTRKVKEHDVGFAKQAHINTDFRDLLVGVYRKTGMAIGPSASMRQLRG